MPEREPWTCEECGHPNDARAALCVVCQKSYAYSSVRRRMREEHSPRVEGSAAEVGVAQVAAPPGSDGEASKGHVNGGTVCPAEKTA